MANKYLTIFQNLDKTLNGQWSSTTPQQQYHVNSYDMKGGNVIFSTKNKQEYEKKKLELRQEKFLANMWTKTSSDIANQQIVGISNIKLMYRDVELMDNFPEIGAALDIYADESCVANDNGQIVKVYSESNRIKSIIEDLLVNRLDITIIGPMIIRSMCKYGNEYMLLNISGTEGVVGWKQLPVAEMERNENGINNPYSFYSANVNGNDNKDKTEEISFNWLGQSEMIQFRNWQVAHFRLITDSIFLPYGTSVLNKARRHWRILSMMEDMMLIYRLERSIERRVYKIYVGAIDDQDVPAYIEQIANNFKRTPIIDPQTGQVDLRKNIMSVDQDIFIPVRDPGAPNPIDTLQAAQNLTAIDDIKYIQLKVLAGLRIPKSFLNFENEVGNGNNLSLLDVRFARVINRIQQAFLMELTKVVTIHLYLMGFRDDLTNFTLTMNNPSTQAEQLEIENLEKKITAVRDAVSDPGNGIPIMSVSRACKDILKWSENDIKDNLEEIRLEKALAAELEKTAQIIKRTGVFDSVDKTYGEPNAQYMEDQQGGMPEGADGGAGGMGGGSFGGGLEDMGGPGDEANSGVLNGEEGNMSPQEAGGADEAQPNIGGDEQTQGNGTNESKKLLKNILTENKIKNNNLKYYEKSFFKEYINKLNEEKDKENINYRVPPESKNLFINEEYNNILNEIGKHLKK